jgi:hypothetical protein
MVAITALVLLSTLAIAFVRFLIAICKQSKGQRICHLVRLRACWVNLQLRHPGDGSAIPSSRLNLQHPNISS